MAHINSEFCGPGQGTVFSDLSDLASSCLCSLACLFPCSSISVLLYFSQVISVKVIDDEEYEKNKTFFIELGEPRMAEMSEKKGGRAAPGPRPTASAGLCLPGCLHSSEHDLQCTHASTMYQGIALTLVAVGQDCSYLSQLWPLHQAGLKVHFGHNPSSLHSWGNWRRYYTVSQF